MASSMSIEREHTCDGSVDWNNRRPIKSKTGGWRSGILLLFNQALATMALSGVGVNLVLFMTRVMQQDNAEAANNVSVWTGTTCIFSLLGAFISDSYWGRYKTCAIFQFIFICGLLELTLSSHFLLKKNREPTVAEIVVFKLSIYQIALGNGAYQPVVATFGADQFDENDPLESQSKIAFFSYFYLANNLGTLVSNTFLAYIEDQGDWVLGFGVSSAAALIAVVLFMAGTWNFRYFKATGNTVCRICQVLSVKKFRLQETRAVEDLYEAEKNHENVENGLKRILHTPNFKSLDKAAIITEKEICHNEDERRLNQWNLCTVTQVEELKCILRLLPIWLCTIMYSVVYAQMASVFIEQGAAMKRRIRNFDIPPASMSIFEILGVAFLIFLYQNCIVPLLRRLKKSSKGISELRKMGIGLVMAALTMISAGIVETQRLKYSRNNSSSLSIVWQIPQYVLMGASEVFMYVAQLEFFNAQTPDGLKSFGSALYIASMAAGNYVSSLLVTLVMKITTSTGDKIVWISENLNQGHTDRFYFLIAALTAIDIGFFIASAMRFRCISLKRSIDETNEATNTPCTIDV